VSQSLGRGDHTMYTEGVEGRPDTIQPMENPMFDDQVNSELNIIEDEEMIDLSVPDEYNEYNYDTMVRWRNLNPLSE
jgi:hypothetical protein